MGLFSKREPKHSNGQTAAQDNRSKHGREPRRRIPARLCSCGSGISANVCNCQRIRSGRTRVPTMGKGTTRKWGKH